MNFIDVLTNTGVKVNIEHIDGKQNVLADQLSRICNLLTMQGWNQSGECTEEIKTLSDTIEEVMSAEKKGVDVSMEKEELCHLLEQLWLEDTPKSPVKMSQTISGYSQGEEWEHCKTLQMNKGTMSLPNWTCTGPWSNTIYADGGSGQMAQHLQMAQHYMPTQLMQNEQPTSWPKQGTLSLKPINETNTASCNFQPSRRNDVRAYDNQEEDIIVDPGWDDFALQATRDSRPLDPHLYPNARRSRI